MPICEIQYAKPFMNNEDRRGRKCEPGTFFSPGLQSYPLPRMPEVNPSTIRAEPDLYRDAQPGSPGPQSLSANCSLSRQLSKGSVSIWMKIKAEGVPRVLPEGECTYSRDFVRPRLKTRRDRWSLSAPGVDHKPENSPHGRWQALFTRCLMVGKRGCKGRGQLFAPRSLAASGILDTTGWQMPAITKVS